MYICSREDPPLGDFIYYYYYYFVIIKMLRSSLINDRSSL